MIASVLLPLLPHPVLCFFVLLACVPCLPIDLSISLCIFKSVKSFSGLADRLSHFMSDLRCLLLAVCSHACRWTRTFVHACIFVHCALAAIAHPPPPDPLVDLTMRVLPADICRRGRSWSPRRAPLASCAPTMPSTAWQLAASNPSPPSYCFYCSAFFVNYFKALSCSILLPFYPRPLPPHSTRIHLISSACTYANALSPCITWFIHETTLELHI